MLLKKKDSYFLIAILGLILLLAFGAIKDNGRDTPYDESHWPSYLAIKQGKSRDLVEKGCSECHLVKTIEKHPPKEQCLICHKLVKL
jgi:hypothetical protein